MLGVYESYDLYLCKITSYLEKQFPSQNSNKGSTQSPSPSLAASISQDYVYIMKQNTKYDYQSQIPIL